MSDLKYRAAETADVLKAKAVQHAGLSDFGDDAEYLPGLRELLQAIDTDMPLTPDGRDMAHGALLGSLASRLYAHEGWKERPDCLTRPIKAPVIIQGLPRTGTTALHRLLSFDLQFQGPELWLMGTPMPRPPRAQWERHARYRECVAMIEGMTAAAPLMSLLHPRGADLVDECNDITAQCYVQSIWGGYFPVPSYDTWWPRQDHAVQFRYLRRVLQLIGADDGRTWLLKDPTFIAWIPQLLDVFPDARLIVTHRDPVDAIPSFCALAHAAQSTLLGDRVDAAAIGVRNLEVWSEATRKFVSADTASTPRIDVHMHALKADPMSVVRRIYERFDLTLSPEAAQAMQACIKQERAKRQVAPRVAPEQFGLDAMRIHQRFAPYIERFGPFDAV